MKKPGTRRELLKATAAVLAANWSAASQANGYSGEIANKRFLLDPTHIGRTGFPTGTLGKPFGAPNPLSAFGLPTLPPRSKKIRIVDCEFGGPWRSKTSGPEAARVL